MTASFNSLSSKLLFVAVPVPLAPEVPFELPRQNFKAEIYALTVFPVSRSVLNPEIIKDVEKD